jgi:tryptophanyl-tRNA synthetase
MNKPFMFTGMQPTGKITLGNYLGVLKPLLNDQDKYFSLICIVDLHAYTSLPEKSNFKKQIKELSAFYLSIGFKSENAKFFIQSSVKQHLDLAWVMQCLTSMGELSRMTQYKEKTDKGYQGVGLFTYPTLMAADILLYNSDLVYVGQDQKQHLELTRDLANRFNNRYSETFTIPESVIQKVGFKIMSLQNPSKKMSKSDENESSSIYVTDSPAQIRKKIGSAVTDSIGIINYDLENQPGISNLLTILATLTNTTPESIVERYNEQKNKATYKQLKDEVAQAIIAELEPIQVRMQEMLENDTKREEILEDGANFATSIAYKTMSKVYRKTGIGGK